MSGLYHRLTHALRGLLRFHFFRTSTMAMGLLFLLIACAAKQPNVEVPAVRSGEKVSSGVESVALPFKPMLIGAGDLLSIEVQGEPNCTRDFAVSNLGLISFCYVGEVKALGKTSAELDQQLTTLLARDFIKNPDVKVSVKQSRINRVFVFGSIEKPGPYSLGEDRSLARLLQEAGMSPSGAGQTCSIVRTRKIPGTDTTPSREESQTTLVDLARVLSGQTDVSLEAGDVIQIGTATNIGPSVRILGEVNKPGTYAIRSGQTVLDVVLDAGGFTEFASPNRTRIVRGEGKTKEIIVVKMKDVMKDGSKEKDTVLKAGDLIVVPEAIF